MKAFIPLLLAVPVALASSVARADDKATCLDAVSRGQRVRDAHRLLEARERFRTCAAAVCPAAVQTDCAAWLAEVEKALPSVVLSAKSGAGADLLDVKVTVDGQPFVSKLDGEAVPIDPGAHAFHFEGADGAAIDQQVIVREGEKGRAISVVLGASSPAPATPQPTGQSTAPPSNGSSPSSSSPWRTAGWILGGAGVAGLAVGGIFGAVALSDKNGAHCDSSGACDAGTAGGIKSAALVSDIGWVAGGVLLASGAALVLFAPTGTGDGTDVKVTGTLVQGGAGAVLAGRW